VIHYLILTYTVYFLLVIDKKNYPVAHSLDMCQVDIIVMLSLPNSCHRGLYPIIWIKK